MKTTKPRRKAIVLAVVVVAAGASLAWVFYRTPVSPPTYVHQEPIVRRAEDGPRFLMEVRSGPLVEPAQPEPAAPVSRPMDALAGLPLFEASGDALPRMAHDYPSTQADEPAGKQPLRRRIVDGDTLPALAQRYLGDAARAQELFELNRAVLESAELLPIGAVIEIPPR